MPKQPKRIRVVPVPRDKPDLERLARAIVAVALQQLEKQRRAEGEADASGNGDAASSPPSDGAAA